MASILGTRRRVRLTWQQRLCGLCFAAFIFMHVPTFTFLVEYSDDTVRQQYWSPLQVVGVGLLRTNPEWFPYIRYVLLPGTAFETLTALIDECYINPGNDTPCDWSKLTDLEGLLAKADFRDKVDIFADRLGDHRQMVQAAAAMATCFSCTSAFLDGTVGLLLGYAGLAYLVAKAECTVIAPTNMCIAAIITVYALMGAADSKQGAATAASTKPAAEARAPGAAGAQGTTPLEPRKKDE